MIKRLDSWVGKRVLGRGLVPHHHFRYKSLPLQPPAAWAAAADALRICISTMQIVLHVSESSKVSYGMVPLVLAEVGSQNFGP
jgi:hypothetical protein